MAIDIKENVRDGRVCTFRYFRDGALWYETHTGDLFPVPVEEAGSATFHAQEKALFLMRWMRKFNEDRQQMGVG